MSITKNEVAAFDYQTQKWMTGPEAVPLRIEQILTDLATLSGPNGSDYARFIAGGDREALIAGLKSQLSDLQRLQADQWGAL